MKTVLTWECAFNLKRHWFGKYSKGIFYWRFEALHKKTKNKKPEEKL